MIDRTIVRNLNSCMVSLPKKVWLPPGGLWERMHAAAIIKIANALNEIAQPGKRKKGLAAPFLMR
jgi:hypothetical protein